MAANFKIWEILMILCWCILFFILDSCMENLYFTELVNPKSPKLSVD